MNVDLRHNPSFAAARITLGPNEEIRAELEAWIRQLMPGETGGSGGNVLGGILGR